MTQHKAIAYAEDQLGVHRTWANCEAITVALADLYDQQAGFEAESRNLNHQIDALKDGLLVRESAVFPEMAPTAFERHMRLVIAKDENLTAVKRTLLECMARRDVVAGQIRAQENNHKGSVARLNELGGYFNYLAQVRMAATMAANAVADFPWQ